jgi:nucleoside-diphosphate-sugar epimerase
VVEANLLAMTADCEYGVPMNCACNRCITVNQLTAEINQILGKTIKPIYTEPRPGDIKHSLADINRAEAWLNYKPLVSFEQGLRLTIDAMGAET